MPRLKFGLILKVYRGVGDFAEAVDAAKDADSPGGKDVTAEEGASLWRQFEETFKPIFEQHFGVDLG